MVEKILLDIRFALTPVPETHLCCGSAGTRALLQGKLAQRLLARNLEALCSSKPQEIVTANIGCLTHLHWLAGIAWLRCPP